MAARASLMIRFLYSKEVPDFMELSLSLNIPARGGGPFDHAKTSNPGALRRPARRFFDAFVLIPRRR
jgi:hypothetical protein